MKTAGDFYRRFGERLRHARRAVGLSQVDLAMAIKLTRTSVSNIEQGRQRVLLHTFEKMLHVLNVQPNDLLPSDHTRPGLLAAELNSLARDELNFVRRGLGKFEEEEHGSKLGTDSEESQGLAEGV